MRTENDLVLMYGMDRNSRVCVLAGNDLFLVWGSIDMLFVWVVQIDLVSVYGPGITWF